MPRNSSGTYSLYTPGNPVVTNTVISSTWANNTLADLASALTDSLSRSGDGGMQAPLELTNGAIGAPAVTWSAETTSGWYRASAGNFRFSVSAADALTVTSSGLGVAAGLTVTGATVLGAATGGGQGVGTVNAVGVYDDGVLLANQVGANPSALVGLSAVNGSAGTFMRSDAAPALDQAIAPSWTGIHTWSGNTPETRLYESDQSAGSRLWRDSVAASIRRFQIGDDAAGNLRDWLAVYRSGTSPAAVDALEFGNTTNNPVYNFLGTGTTSHGGDVTFTVGSSFAAGYRGMPSRTITTSDSTAAADNGRTILFTGAGSQTFTVDSDFGTAGNLCVVLNGGTGSLAIAESLSGTMTWLNGSGTLSTGSRTLAIGGIATIWMADANNAYIWGTGVT